MPEANDIAERLETMASVRTSALFSQRKTLYEAAALIRDLKAENERLRDGGEVNVRDLVWETSTCGPDEYTEFADAGPFGFRYEIERREHFGKFVVTRSRDIQPFAWKADIEAAKTAAQQDYDTRIRSAIGCTPSDRDAGIAEGMERAAVIAVEHAEGSERLLAACRQDNDRQGALVHSSEALVARHLASAIRAAKEDPTNEHG